MTGKPQWRPFEFGDVERRLTEAKDLLAQAARMIEAEESARVDALASTQLEQARRRDVHPQRRRYR